MNLGGEKEYGTKLTMFYVIMNRATLNPDKKS
jgi:hypothetical protein